MACAGLWAAGKSFFFFILPSHKTLNFLSFDIAQIEDHVWKDKERASAVLTRSKQVQAAIENHLWWQDEDNQSSGYYIRGISSTTGKPGNFLITVPGKNKITFV